MEEARECALERQKTEDVIDAAKNTEEGDRPESLKDFEDGLLTDEELDDKSSDETAVVSNTEGSSAESRVNQSDVESMEI